MIKPCIYCKNQVYWLPLNGNSKPFNDSQGSFRHTCKEFINMKDFQQKQISELYDTVEGLKNIIPKILSKIDILEKRDT